MCGALKSGLSLLESELAFYSSQQMFDRRLSPVAAFEESSLSGKLIAQNLVSHERGSNSFWLDFTYIQGMEPLFLPLGAQPVQQV